MRRNLGFISAAVTTFTAVVLASVVYAYRGFAESPSTSTTSAGSITSAAQVADSPNAQAAPVNVPQAGPQASTMTAQAAAALAGKFLNRTDLYSAQLTTYNSVSAYKIVFTSGDAVFVSLDGQILGMIPAPATVTAPPVFGSSGGGHHPGSSSSGHEDGGTEHESEGGG